LPPVERGVVPADADIDRLLGAITEVISEVGRTARAGARAA